MCGICRARGIFLSIFIITEYDRNCKSKNVYIWSYAEKLTDFVIYMGSIDRMKKCCTLFASFTVFSKAKGNVTFKIKANGC